jgi:excisionase family DNA binding protein
MRSPVIIPALWRPTGAAMEKTKTVECPADRALKVREVADSLGIGMTLAWGLIRRGEIASVKIGGARRVQRSAIAEYLARVTTPAAGAGRG